MDHWHLIQFKPNSHRRAELNLKRQGFKTFLPMQEITLKKASSFTNDLKPLFPGYMFVRVETETEPWRKINSTIGVSRLVSFDGKPKPLPLQLVSGLMLRCNCFGKLLPPKTLAAGDSVQLLTGPFTNFITTVEEIDVEQRVWVLMEFMGQCTRLKVASKQLQLKQ